MALKFPPLAIIPLALALGCFAPLPVKAERGWPVLDWQLPEAGTRLTVGSSGTADLTLQFRIHRGQLFRNGYRVAFFLNGRRYDLFDEKPLRLSGLQPGIHHLRMELRDRRGEVVPGALSVQQRTLQILPRGTNSVTPQRRAAISPQTHQGTISSDQSANFTVRPGGRREGPVPREDPQITSRGAQTAPPAAAAATVSPLTNPADPTNDNTPTAFRPFNSEATDPENGSDASPRNDGTTTNQPASNGGQTTISETIRQNLIPSTVRLNAPVEPMRILRGASPVSSDADTQTTSTINGTNGDES